ncbi:MAG: single-stranded DNA-binding protein [Anaeroplasmataceae bacterium]
MYNYVFILGRIVKDVEIRKTQDDRSVSTLTLAVTRPFKNSANNTYDTDFVNITLWEQISEVTSEYCKKGDMVAVKGRIQTKTDLINDKKVSIIEIIGERVIFVSSKKNNTLD